MEKFTKGFAALAVFGILTFGINFDKVEAAENSSAIVSEDLNLNVTDDKEFFALPPPRYGPRHPLPPPRYGPRHPLPPPKYGPRHPLPPPRHRSPHRHGW